MPARDAASPEGTQRTSGDPSPPAPERAWAFEDAGDNQVLPRFDYRVDFASATARGAARDNNEDVLLCRPDMALFGVADGMGGHAAGEVAAKLSLSTCERELATKAATRVLDKYAANPKLDNRRAVIDLLGRVIQAANESVLEAGREDSAQRGMGTTLDLLLLVRNRAFVAHVGDSRAYLVRRTATLQLTNDHAAFDSLQLTGKRTPTARYGRSPLANSIGARPEVQVDTVFVDFAPGDRFVLCTDGVFGLLGGEAKMTEMCAAPAARQICTNLLDNVLEQRGHDDATAVVVRIGKRFVMRRDDPGPRALDLAVVSASPLLCDLPPAAVLNTLDAAVEVEIDAGEEVPRAVANDRVAYLVLDGAVRLGGGRTLGASALLMAESLLDVAGRGRLPKVVDRARLLRIRHDDFKEVCSHDPQLAAQLYMRLARHLAMLD
jgi:serine/threonine protein phosphatase PrpC